MTLPAHTGTSFCSTVRHDTDPAIDPSKAANNLAGKVVLITGASKGIGRAIAVAYAQTGVSGLVLLARSKSGLEDTQKLSVDTTELDGIVDALKSVESTFGRLDIVVNDAGVMESFKLLGDADPTEWWRTWEVGIKGFFNVTKATLPLLIGCGGDKTIVNVGSISAHNIGQLVSAYQASKLAMLRLSELIVAEYGDKGIICYSIHPGTIPTDMSYQMPKEWRHVLVDTAELAAHTVVFYSKEKRDWLAGRYLSAQWDVDELLAKKEEIVGGDKLKVRMVV